ncbi:hypothetical protein LXL04_011425 [Taraxacum kok-saghyz]
MDIIVWYSKLVPGFGGQMVVDRKRKVQPSNARFVCVFCRMAFASVFHLKMHGETSAHRTRLSIARNGRENVSNPFLCEVCDILCSGGRVMEVHVAGIKHAERLREFEDAKRARIYGFMTYLVEGDANTLRKECLDFEAISCIKCIRARQHKPIKNGHFFGTNGKGKVDNHYGTEGDFIMEIMKIGGNIPKSFYVFILTFNWQNGRSTNWTSVFDLIHPTIQTTLMENMSTVFQTSNLVIFHEVVQADCTTGS